MFAHQRNCVVATVVFLLFWSACFCIARGQTVEQGDVETLTPSELGPYRPEFKADVKEAVDRVIEEVNKFRTDEGLDEVSEDDSLREAAVKFAQYMAENDRYGHHADGRTASARARVAGYEMCMIAENIAFRFETEGIATEDLVSRLVSGWKNSPPHRKNMLSTMATETGVGIAKSEETGGYYAVQLFGLPRSAAFEFSVANRTKDDVAYKFGERSFTLPAGFTRTHRVCQGGDLMLQKEGEVVDQRSISENQELEVVREEDGIGFAG